MTIERGRSLNALKSYLAEIKDYELLSAEKESELAYQFRAGNQQAGHHLVTSNLRFVVKIARQYRSHGIGLADLIQEGNLGLMRAVQRFDPNKGIRLISYAVWWIRAFVQNHIIRSWSLVKLGTTQAQRKLFCSLAKTRRHLEKLGEDPEHCDAEKIAQLLNVSPGEVAEMQLRMSGRDSSLEDRVGRGGESDGATLAHFLASPQMSQEEGYANKEEAALIGAHVRTAISRLDHRERYIIEQRAMADRAMTLKEVGDHFGFSRERARQIEIRAKEKLHNQLQQVCKLAA